MYAIRYKELVKKDEGINNNMAKKRDKKISCEGKCLRGIIIVCLIRSRRFMRESTERSGISGFLMWHLAANLSIRELITDAREKSIGPAILFSTGISAGLVRISSAKSILMAVCASIQVSASMRWDSLVRLIPVLIS